MEAQAMGCRALGRIGVPGILSGSALTEKRVESYVTALFTEKNGPPKKRAVCLVVVKSACQLANQLGRLFVAETFVEHQDLGIGDALEIQFEVVDGIFDLGIPMHENLETAADD